MPQPVDERSPLIVICDGQGEPTRLHHDLVLCTGIQALRRRFAFGVGVNINVIVEGTASRKDFDEYKYGGDLYGFTSTVDWGDVVAEGEEHPDPEYMASNWGEPVWVIQELSDDGWKAWKKGTGWGNSKDEEFGIWEFKRQPDVTETWAEGAILMDTEEEAQAAAAQALLDAMEAAGEAVLRPAEPSAGRAGS